MNAREALKKELNTRQTTKVLDRGVGRADLSAVNEKLILNHIRQHGPVSRVSLAGTFGLSRATVSAIVSRLLTDGLVKEGDPVRNGKSQGGKPDQGGKPAIELHFKAEAGYILGVDIGRRHLRVLLTDLKGRMPAKVEFRSTEFDTTAGAETCLTRVADELQTFLKTSEVAWDDILGIGVGIPGTLDHDLQKLVDPPEMPQWGGVEIPKVLRRLLNSKGKIQLPIYLDNDANMGALGESRYGAGKNILNLAYIKIGTGIGAGLILDGHLYRGSKGTAGEFGHIIIEKEGPECPGCHNSSCLEVLAAGPAIVKEILAAEPAIVKEAGNDEIDIEKAAKLARDGNKACQIAIEHAGERIGRALAGLIDLLDPEEILVDGGVVRAAEDLLLPPLKEHATACVPAAAGTVIQVGDLGITAIAYGAVATVIDAAFGTQTILEAAFGIQSVAARGLVATTRVG